VGDGKNPRLFFANPINLCLSPLIIALSSILPTYSWKSQKIRANKVFVLLISHEQLLRLFLPTGLIYRIYPEAFVFLSSNWPFLT
jgi:hypothetical protein